MNRIDNLDRDRQAYYIRISGCMAFALILAIGAIRFWPTWEDEPADIVYDARSQELIQIEEIQQTQQQASRPPPPAPLTPVVVPDDVVLDEIEIELTEELITADTGEDDLPEEEGAATPQTGGSTQPDAGPRAFRVVQPEYPREARRRNVRAEVFVEVQVDRRGRVESARVVDRFLLKGRDNAEREAVTELGYGLEDAAVAAASEWMFRPARQNGRTVRSLTVVTLSFGI